MPWFKRAARSRRPAVLSPCPNGAGAVRVEPNGGLPRVAGFAIQDGPVSADGLERLAREAGIKGQPLVALLDHDRYQTVMVEAPSVPEEEIRGAIRWKVKDLISFHVDDAVMDYLLLPAGAGRHQSLYVVAAQSQAVRELAAPYQQAGLGLEVIDVRECAQHNLGLRLAPPDYAAALLHFDGVDALLTFSFGEDLITSRRIEGRGATGEGLYDRVALETQRSVDFFERQFSWLPLAKLFLAPAPDPAIPALGRRLREYLHVGVEAVELDQWFDWGGHERLRDARLQNRVFHLLCAALREGAP